MIWSWRAFWMAGTLSVHWLSSYGIWKSTILGEIQATEDFDNTHFVLLLIKANLSWVIEDFLTTTAKCTPSVLITKPKFHFLLHCIFLPTYDVLDQPSYSPQNITNPLIMYFAFCVFIAVTQPLARTHTIVLHLKTPWSMLQQADSGWICTTRSGFEWGVPFSPMWHLIHTSPAFLASKLRSQSLQVFYLSYGSCFTDLTLFRGYYSDACHFMEGS